MNTLITLCRDVEGPTSTDCIDDHEELDGSLIEPCKVVLKGPCDEPNTAEHVGPEAESSAAWREMADEACCDC